MTYWQFASFRGIGIRTICDRCCYYKLAAWMLRSKSPERRSGSSSKRKRASTKVVGRLPKDKLRGEGGTPSQGGVLISSVEKGSMENSSVV